MKEFNDSIGRKWVLSLTLADAVRIKAHLGVDILAPERPSEGYQSLADRLMKDEILLAQIIACMLEKQFEERGISEDEIYSQFDAATMKASLEAFFEEMIDFFRKSGRKDRAELFSRANLLMKKGIDLIEEKLSSISIEDEIKEMETRLNQAFGNRSGNSPE